MGRPPIPVIERKMNTAFTLSPNTIDILDKVRGRKSRSAYVENLLLKEPIEDCAKKTK